MKNIFYLLSIVVFFSFLLSSCNDTTYATELKNEKLLIQDFIKRQEINVITTLPPDSTIWNENDYYLTPDGMYFHLVHPGYGTDTLESNDKVVPRYLQYTLNIDADTVRNWTTIDSSYPKTFNYLDYTQSCTAFHVAVGIMKRNESEAKLIVPSKMNFNDFWTPATPIGYDIKIKFQK